MALVVNTPPANAGDIRLRFDPWVRKIPWRRAWQPTPVVLPGKSQGQRSPMGRLQSIVSQRIGYDWSNLTHTHTHTPIWAVFCLAKSQSISFMHSFSKYLTEYQLHVRHYSELWENGNKESTIKHIGKWRRKIAEGERGNEQNQNRCLCWRVTQRSKRAALGTSFIPETHLGQEDRNYSRHFKQTEFHSVKRLHWE